MKVSHILGIGGLIGTAMSLLLTLPAASAAHKAVPAVSQRDGQHDFDFNVGVWQTHITRMPDPLSGSTKSLDLEGTVTVRKIWGGRAQLEEIETDGPNGHWEGMTLFLYNPTAHQWSQTFINSKMGELNAPLIGRFTDNRGELVASDTFKGRSILVRGTWSDIKPGSHHYEEAYSDDGGKTWAPAFIANLTAAAGGAPVPSHEARAGSHDRDGSHDFDFYFGTWKERSSRLLHPLTGSKDWVDMTGVTVVNKIWDGRANIAEFKSDGPLELISLRWYNPAAHQWNVDFATPGVGMLGVPAVGEFKNGRGDFYDQETINGRSVLVRFSIWRITDNTAQSEQAFSDDGGKTWEVNWINRYTRDGQ